MIGFPQICIFILILTYLDDFIMIFVKLVEIIPLIFNPKRFIDDVIFGVSYAIKLVVGGMMDSMDSGTASNKEENPDQPEDRNYETNGLSEWEGTYSYFPSVPKPIIAAINGPAAGVGLIMSLYCDMRVASEDAVFSTAFSKRGLIAEWGVGWILPRIIGVAHTMDIMMTARKFDAKEAERIGLVNRCFPAESFMEDVMTYAEDIAQNVSPRSVQIMKRQIYTALGEDIKTNLKSSMEEMVKSFGSEDFKEGVKHFIEKRPAKFTGK